jgi:hypothetical protein
MSAKERELPKVVDGKWEITVRGTTYQLRELTTREEVALGKEHADAPAAEYQAYFLAKVCKTKQGDAWQPITAEQILDLGQSIRLRLINDGYARGLEALNEDIRKNSSNSSTPATTTSTQGSESLVRP